MSFPALNLFNHTVYIKLFEEFKWSYSPPSWIVNTNIPSLPMTISRRHLVNVINFYCSCVVLKAVRKKMAASERYFVFLLLNFFLLSVCCLPEPGKKDLHFDKVSENCRSWLNSWAESCIFCLIYDKLSCRISIRFLHACVYFENIFKLTNSHILIVVFRTERMEAFPKQWAKATLSQ